MNWKERGLWKLIQSKIQYANGKNGGEMQKYDVNDSELNDHKHVFTSR